jgi:hypothetical protein
MTYKNKLLFAALFATSLSANSDVNSFSELFSEGKAYGNIKYYYIQTDKDKSYTNEEDTSAKANSIGGQVGFHTARLKGFSAAATFMTTNPFLISDDPANVDTSIIAKDNGALGGDATEGFSVVGEAYISFDYSGFNATYGRKVIKTPLMHAKEVRMLPSAFNGLYTSYSINQNQSIGLSYITDFKQRTSDSFVNVIEHALGENTKEIIGSDSGSVVVGNYKYSAKQLSVNVYDYYAKDFLNSIYLDTHYAYDYGSLKLQFGAQYIDQRSIGNADRNLAETTSLTNGQTIEAKAFGVMAKGTLAYGTLTMAYSKVLTNDSKHDSLVLPWDGTPLFTNMITSNDLFQSLYGNGLKSDSIYIGGSEALKVAYTQRFDGLGLKGLSLTAAAMRTDNAKFSKGAQYDYNAVLAYKYNKSLSLALKGIWVENNSAADINGVVTQLKELDQYRVIANYKF